uniref:Uncharacterized protein n=1 Tax=Oryza brachyantha TaxID=4533 RepID=J3MYP5_ORYBR
MALWLAVVLHGRALLFSFSCSLSLFLCNCSTPFVRLKRMDAQSVSFLEAGNSKISRLD